MISMTNHFTEKATNNKIVLVTTKIKGLVPLLQASGWKLANKSVTTTTSAVRFFTVTTLQSLPERLGIVQKFIAHEGSCILATHISAIAMMRTTFCDRRSQMVMLTAPIFPMALAWKIHSLMRCVANSMPSRVIVLPLGGELETIHAQIETCTDNELEAQRAIIQEKKWIERGGQLLALDTHKLPSSFQPLLETPPCPEENTTLLERILKH